MADNTKNAWNQPNESPIGTIAKEDMVVPYGDPTGSANMLDISWKSLIVWIWNKLTGQSATSIGQLLTADNNLADVGNSQIARQKLKAQNRYLEINRNFTSSGSSSRVSATLIPILVGTVIYDVVLLKHDYYYRLPLLADDATLADGQQITIMREMQSVAHNPTITSDQLYNASDLSLDAANNIVNFFYDANENLWRIHSTYGV